MKQERESTMKRKIRIEENSKTGEKKERKRDNMNEYV